MCSVVIRLSRDVHRNEFRTHFGGPTGKKFGFHVKYTKMTGIQPFRIIVPYVKVIKAVRIQDKICKSWADLVLSERKVLWTRNLVYQTALQAANGHFKPLKSKMQIYVPFSQDPLVVPMSSHKKCMLFLNSNTNTFSMNSSKIQ